MLARLPPIAIVLASACGTAPPRAQAPVVAMGSVVCSSNPEDPCVDRCAAGDLDICGDLRIALRLVCSPDNAHACYRLALMLETGEGIEHEFGVANAMHQRACQWGSGASCARLGFLHSTGDGISIDFVRAARMLKAACSASNTLGCEPLHVLRTIPDWGRGRAIYRRACDLGHGDACHALGTIYELGIGVDSDAEEAERLYVRACDTGDEHACASRAYVFGDRRPPASCADEDTRQYERLCADGDGAACHRLGLVYVRADDDNRAMAVMLGAHFLGRACRAGIRTACVSRQELPGWRRGIEDTHPNWEPVSAKGCDARHQLCREHQIEIVQRVGAPPPIALAKPHEVEELFYRAALYKQACDRGNSGGCFRLGVMFQSGSSMPQHRERAIEYLRLACRARDSVAGCEALRLEMEQPRRPVQPMGTSAQLAVAPE